MGEFDDVQLRIRVAAAEAINRLADKVAADAIPETPIENGELRASELYPGNDAASACQPDSLADGATVSFNTVYAAAQHEGEALQHWMHPRIPIIKGGVLVGFFTDTSKVAEKDVMWIVKNYSEPGTKSHYLEDPFKATIPRMELFMAASISAALK